MMNFADGFGLGRVCLVLGIVLMAWGACREPMMPTRPAVVVPGQLDVEVGVPVEPANDADVTEVNVPVVARHEKGKTKP